MSHFLAHLGLPLLTKELIEQSARKRTYVIRVLYAIALYGTTLWVFHQQLGSWNAAGLAVLGKGRSLYTSLAWLEFAGIYIFLPAMTCGVLTAEKEKDTLGLLLLTKLGPWTIVFEKLFSRLVPMASFVLLSLPLLAVAYSLGGVESVDIAKLMWVLAMTALQVGTFAVLCSAWFRTTAAAFLATYLLGVVAILVSGVFCEFVCHSWFVFSFQGLLSDPAFQWLVNMSNPNRGFLTFGPRILNGGELFQLNSFGGVVLREQTLLDCVVMTLPLFGMSAISLTLARTILWRRAFVQPKNVLLKLFKSLDGFFHRVNHNRLTRGIVLIRESVALPLYHPISWRETSKRSLGTTRYLVRFLILLEVPVLIMVLWPASEDSIRSGFAPAYVTGWCLWLVATLVLAIQSTGLIGTERSHQSLDVLLTTPVESDEIVRQKFAGIWRMIHMLWVPFTTLYLFQMWWESFVNSPSGYYYMSPANSMMFVVMRAVLAVSLYLPTIAWFGFHQGLRCRSQTQAILMTIMAITTLCVVPPVLAWFLMPPQAFMPGMSNPRVSVWVASIGWISPAVVLASIPRSEAEWFLLIVHFGGVAAAYLWLANSARKAFAKRVGRNDGLVDDDVELPVVALSTEDRMARLRSGRIGVRASDDLDSSGII